MLFREVSVVRRKNRMKHKYIVCAKKSVFYVNTIGRYNYCCLLNSYVCAIPLINILFNSAEYHTNKALTIFVLCFRLCSTIYFQNLFSSPNRLSKSVK
jgi:hypothetical protein